MSSVGELSNLPIAQLRLDDFLQDRDHLLLVLVEGTLMGQYI